MEKELFRNQISEKVMEKLLSDIENQNFIDIIKMLEVAPIDYLLEYLKGDPRYTEIKNPQSFRMVRKIETYGIPEQVVVTYKENTFIIISQTENGFVLDVMSKNCPITSMAFEDKNDHSEKIIENI